MAVVNVPFTSAARAAALGRSRMRLALTLALLAWIVVFACAVLGGAGASDVGQSRAVLSSARSHTVAAGETLWSIAEGAGDGSVDTRAVVAEIVALNHLSGTALQAGTVLVLP